LNIKITSLPPLTLNIGPAIMSNAISPETNGQWLIAMRTYLTATAIGNLIWEAAQFPLYTIWSDGSSSHLMLAMFHGTGGDVFIAASALAMSLAAFGDRQWPGSATWRVALPTILIGLAYTFYSEWMNVEVRQVWAYSELMPRLPWIGTGLSPVLQWLIVPSLAFWVTGRSARAG
jgi:hypothetical protein